MKKLLMTVSLFASVCVITSACNNARIDDKRETKIIEVVQETPIPKLETDTSIINQETETPVIEEKTDLIIINQTRINGAESVEIDGNEDLGDKPEPDYFGKGISYTHPLKDINIRKEDEVVIIIYNLNLPFPNSKSYIISDSKAILEAKNDFYYFVSPLGMTPTFYINIFINREPIKNEYGNKFFGAICMHIPMGLSEAIKPIMISEIKDDSTVAIVQPSKGDFFETEMYYNIQ